MCMTFAMYVATNSNDKCFFQQARQTDKAQLIDKSKIL